jgi:hypothetical protein
MGRVPRGIVNMKGCWMRPREVSGEGMTWWWSGRDGARATRYSEPERVLDAAR